MISSRVPRPVNRTIPPFPDYTVGWGNRMGNISGENQPISAYCRRYLGVPSSGRLLISSALRRPMPANTVSTRHGAAMTACRTDLAGRDRYGLTHLGNRLMYSSRLEWWRIGRRSVRLRPMLLKPATTRIASLESVMAAAPACDRRQSNIAPSIVSLRNQTRTSRIGLAGQLFLAGHLPKLAGHHRLAGHLVKLAGQSVGLAGHLSATASASPPSRSSGPKPRNNPSVNATSHTRDNTDACHGSSTALDRSC